MRDNRLPIYHAILDQTLKDQIKTFDRVINLLGHFSRATGADPSGSVTDHLEDLYRMLQAGASHWEIHRMIDQFAGDMPREPGKEFEKFKAEFWNE